MIRTATGRAVRAQLAAILAEQVDGAVLEWMKVVDEPVFLTVGVRSPADPDRLIVRRAALGVQSLQCPGGLEQRDRGLAAARPALDHQVADRIQDGAAGVAEIHHAAPRIAGVRSAVFGRACLRLGPGCGGGPGAARLVQVGRETGALVHLQFALDFRPGPAFASASCRRERR